MKSHVQVKEWNVEECCGTCLLPSSNFRPFLATDFSYAIDLNFLLQRGDRQVSRGPQKLAWLTSQLLTVLAPSFLLCTENSEEATLPLFSLALEKVRNGGSYICEMFWRSICFFPSPNQNISENSKGVCCCCCFMDT